MTRSGPHPCLQSTTADTRAKLIDRALHAFRWVDRVAQGEHAAHGEIQCVQSAARTEIVDGSPLKRRPYLRPLNRP